ncbi:hypothetical protein BDZ89DRAFT_1052223 [Hymenopellis radicata]|nr:hypothetical protein BDZ89DRAFT_1052223 [Hymenopellis radicata]
MRKSTIVVGADILATQRLNIRLQSVSIVHDTKPFNVSLSNKRLYLDDILLHTACWSGDEQDSYGTQYCRAWLAYMISYSLTQYRCFLDIQIDTPRKEQSSNVACDLSTTPDGCDHPVSLQKHASAATPTRKPRPTENVMYQMTTFKIQLHKGLYAEKEDTSNIARVNDDDPECWAICLALPSVENVARKPRIPIISVHPTNCEGPPQTGTHPLTWFVPQREERDVKAASCP